MTFDSAKDEVVSQRLHHSAVQLPPITVLHKCARGSLFNLRVQAFQYPQLPASVRNCLPVCRHYSLLLQHNVHILYPDLLLPLQVADLNSAVDFKHAAAVYHFSNTFKSLISRNTAPVCRSYK